MQKKLIYPLLFAYSLLMIISYNSHQLLAQPKNPKLAQFTTQNSTDQWLAFKANTPLQVKDFVDVQKNILDLPKEYQLEVQKITQDALGFTHHRLQQSYKNVSIEGAHFVVHEKAGTLTTAHGQLITDLNINVIPAINEATALQFALNKVAAKEYAWQNEQYEQTLQDSQTDATATFYPTGELWIARAYDQEAAKAAHYQLIYKFDVYSIVPLQRLWVYVDAHTGEIVQTINRLCSMDVAGTGEKQYGCQQQVGLICHHTGSFYELRENTHGNGIETYTANNEESYPNFIVASNDTHFEEDPVATAVHWGTAQVFDYYLSEHGRSSFNGNGAKLRSWVHYGDNYNNAFWNGAWMTYGDGDGSFFTPLTSIDIIAHEITHGITNYSADLVYAYESGALNESFSDIFGTMIEFYAEPNCADWSMGEEVTPNRNGIRNLQHPKLHGQPNTYQGQFWYNGSEDNGGVHINSGVQNHWFYLLSEGGNGTNDDGTAYSISGIGREKAAQIAYRNLTVYLSATSQYADARSGAIQAAIDLYGAGSEEVLQTSAAWCAVGVGSCQATNKTLTLTAPNGGEIWHEGSSQNISWTTVGHVPQVQLEYSMNNGASWSTITAATGNDGQYTWLVSDRMTHLALIKVTDISNPTVTDESDAPFTIQACSVEAHFTPPQMEVCQQESVIFSNQSTAATHYEWIINDLVVSQETDLEYMFNESGVFVISLNARVADDPNCESKETQLFFVQSTPTADFNYETDNLEVSFFTQFDGDQQYSWDLGDGTISAQPDPNHIYAEAGNYDVCLTVTGDCGTDQACQTLTLNEVDPCARGARWDDYINSNYINDLLEFGDDIYIATEYEGLIKIHKPTNERTVFYTHNSDLPTNQVTALLALADGTILVGTANGLCKFDGSSRAAWTIYSRTNSDLPFNDIRDLDQHSDGTVYVATYQSLSTFDGNSRTGWTVFLPTDSDLPHNLQTILVSNNGMVYIGLHEGIAYFDGSSRYGWTHLTTNNSDLPHLFVYSLLESSDGRIWVGTGGGLAAFDGSQAYHWESFLPNHSDLPGDEVNDLFEDEQGHIWVGTNGGLGVFDGNSQTGWTIYTTGNSDLTINNISHIEQTDEGDFFVSTNGNQGALHRLAGNSGTGWTSTHFTTTALPNNYIRDLEEGADGAIFVATKAGGLAKFDGYQRTDWTVYDTTNSDLPTNEVWTVLTTSQGDVFVGTVGGGLAKFDGQSATGWTIYNTANSDLPDNQVHALLEDEQGHIWVGTYEGGLAKFDGTTPTNWTLYNTDNSNLNANCISSLAQQLNGTLFVGFHIGGLAKFDGTNWTAFTTSNSDLPGLNVTDVSVSSQDDVWVATYGNGVAQFDGSRTTAWTIYQDFFSNNTTDVLERENGELLFATWMGIVLVNQHTAQADSFYQFRSTPLQFLESTRGDLFVGRNKGLSVFRATTEPSTPLFYAPITCTQSSALFENRSTNAMTYTWQVEGTTVSTETDLNYTFTEAGHYNITLIASDGGGCAESYSELVEVYPLASELDLGDDQQACASSGITLSANGDFYYYEWTFNGHVVGSDPTYMATESGTYSLMVTDACDDTATDNMQVLMDNNCVWAGDYNADNIVNNHDLLRVGLAFGETGSTRPEATLNWNAQPSPDWAGNHTPNFKHIDGDGNGIIDLNDQQVLVNNYGQTHGILPTPSISNSPLTLTALPGEAPPSFGANTSLSIEIHLDDSANEGDLSAYGLAFDIAYIIPDAVKVNQVHFHPAESWLGLASIDMMMVEQHLPSHNNAGRLEVALCRTDRQNRIGSGKLGVVMVDVDIVPALDTMRSVAIGLSDIEVVVNNSLSIIAGEGSANAAFHLTDFQADFDITTPPILTQLDLRAFLAPSYNNAAQKMHTHLRQQNELPLQQPFNTYPWFYEGTEGVAQWSDLPINMVDWVFVEIQDELGEKISQKAAALLTDGQVVEVLAGTTIKTVGLAGLTNNQNYTILLRHRHCVDVRSALPVKVTDLSLTVDFTNPNQVLGGTTQLADMGNNQYGLIAGDATGDGVINVQDFNAYQQALIQPTSYNNSDFNGDGAVTIADFNVYQTHASHIGVRQVRY